jgi:hypothetical protein
MGLSQFHLDDLTDDMDERNALAASDIVMNTLYNPETFVSETRIGKMTREYVFFDIASSPHVNPSIAIGSGLLRPAPQALSNVRICCLATRTPLFWCLSLRRRVHGDIRFLFRRGLATGP